MTAITDLILTTAPDDGACSTSDHSNADMLCDYLHQHYQGTNLHKTDEHAGGHKRMQSDVFMAAVDYLDEVALLEYFQQIPWQYPEKVQLLLKGPHDATFQLFQPTQS